MKFNQFATETIAFIMKGVLPTDLKKYEGVDQGQSILLDILKKTRFAEMAGIVRNAMGTLNAGELANAIKIITNQTHQEDARHVVQSVLRSYEQQWGIIPLFADVVQLHHITLAYMGICEFEDKIKITTSADAIADDMIARWSTFANRR